MREPSLKTMPYFSARSSKKLCHIAAIIFINVFLLLNRLGFPFSKLCALTQALCCIHVFMNPLRNSSFFGLVPLTSYPVGEGGSA